MTLIRKRWFRIVAVLVAVAGGSILLGTSQNWFSLRVAAVTALQSVALLYAVLSALSIALYSNYVKGLRDSYIKQIASIRDLLEEFFDKYSASKDADVQEIIGTHIYPLLQLGHDDWLAFDGVSAMRGNVDEAATRLANRESWILTRYLVRIEDELNELGLMFIRRLVTQVHLDLIRGTFLLIVVAMVTIALAHVLPDHQTTNAIVVALSSALVVWACIQTLLLLSFYEQEAADEVGPLEKEEALDGNKDA